MVKYFDAETGKTGYAAKPKGPKDFKDSNNDGIKDLAFKDFQFIKVVDKSGNTELKAGPQVLVE